MNAAIKLSTTAAKYLAQASSPSKLVVTYENGKRTHRQDIVDALLRDGLIVKQYSDSARVHITRHRTGISVTTVYVAA